MNINQLGLEIIKSFETCRLRAFKPTENDVWTIGWGRTKGVKEGDTCTQEQADMWLAEDVYEAEQCVSRHVTAPITDNEFSALVSLVYNIGCSAFLGSTLLRLLNQQDFDGAAAQFKRWNKQAGLELAGLTKRRHMEYELFETA